MDTRIKEYVFFNENVPFKADERVKHVFAYTEREAIFDVKPFEWTAYAVVPITCPNNDNDTGLDDFSDLDVPF